MELGNSLRQRRDDGDRDLVLGIEAGQVACPRHGVCDIEACYSCRRFRGIGGSAIEAGIRCAGPSYVPGVSFLTFLVNPRS